MLDAARTLTELGFRAKDGGCRYKVGWVWTFSGFVLWFGKVHLLLPVAASGVILRTFDVLL